MEGLSRFISVAAFPLVLGGAIALSIGASATGDSAAAMAAVLTLSAGVVVALLERFFPHHESWLHSKGDLGPDIAFAITIGAVSSIVVTPLVVYFGTSLLGALSQHFGLALWPDSWPLLAQLPLALAVAEFPKYWHHRLQHNTDVLWRFHATHHSAPRLYWLNAARFHPLDIIADGLLGGVTLVALGVGIEVIALFNLVSGIHGYFQHANLKLRLGPLNYLFSMAELHRWHHSKTVHEANHNYGQNVILWDLIFGSFYWPKDREPPEAIGIPDLPAFPMTYWRQLASPFTWGRIKRDSRAS
jgi:sterol desaturase/sphingolipid hydroxylase (fatty acid hydroxylase superfamily)